MSLYDQVAERLAVLGTTRHACLNCGNAVVDRTLRMADGAVVSGVICLRGHWPESYSLRMVLKGQKPAIRQGATCPDWEAGSMNAMVYYPDTRIRQ